MADLKVKNQQDVESREKIIKEMYELSTLRLLTRGANVNGMKAMLRPGNFLLATGNEQNYCPYLCRYILGAEKRNSEGLSVKLVDKKNFERVYNKLSQASDGFWNFELVQKIEPDKKIGLW